MKRFVPFPWISMFLWLPALSAQDSRTVTEPVFPPACTRLDAQLSVDASGIGREDEGKLDTGRIQTAIDHCTKGHAVELRVQGTNNAFLSGPLDLRAGVTLLVDKGVTLFASRDPALFSLTPGSCGLVNELVASTGCKPFIAVDHAVGAGIMGDGIIDGRAGEKMLGSNLTWWDLAEHLKSGQHQQVPRLLLASYADDFTLYRITLKNSGFFHIVYNHGDGFTIWGLKIDSPRLHAPNADGIDPGQSSKNITITHSFIRAGDDNVAIKGDGDGVTNMTISHNHFYWGHGMSIGSETNGGVSKVRVFDLSLDGTDSGIRIKSNASRGGLVHDVEYDDVCIRDSMYPINIDTRYGEAGNLPGDLIPEYRDVRLHNVRISGGGKISIHGYSKERRAGVSLDGVVLTDADSAKYTYSIDHADLHLGPGPANLKTDGTDSTVSGTAGSGSLGSCDAKFVPFPRP